MRSDDGPEFLKLEMRSTPPRRGTLEFKRAPDGDYAVLAFHHGPGMSTSEARSGRARAEDVAELARVLAAIRLRPRSGDVRVIHDGNQIEVRTPGGHFQFCAMEAGENGVAFLHHLRLVCDAVLDEATYRRWGLDAL